MSIGRVFLRKASGIFMALTMTVMAFTSCGQATNSTSNAGSYNWQSRYTLVGENYVESLGVTISEYEHVNGGRLVYEKNNSPQILVQ